MATITFEYDDKNDIVSELLQNAGRENFFE